MPTLIICTDSRFGEEVGRVVRGAKVIVGDVQDAITQTRKSVRAYVIVRRWIDRKAVAEIETLRRRAVNRPVILLTDPNPDNLRQLCHVRLAGIVWWEEWARELPRTLASVGIRWLAMEFAANVREVPHAIDYAHLTDAIQMICREGPPLPSTRGFAATACVSESTLARHLRGLLGQTWTPHALIETIGVLMALDLVQDGWRLQNVHHRLGVHEDTLRSWARRQCSASLAELRRHPGLALERVWKRGGSGDDQTLTETSG